MKFFREKNAISIQNTEKITPNISELDIFLINKLSEKANQVEVICNEVLRNDYLKNKNKLEKAMSITEKEVKKILAKRLSVDLLQLYMDLLKLYQIKINKGLSIINYNIEELEYKSKILEICNALNQKENKKAILDKLYEIILNYISLYGFDISEIETNRKAIEEKEGNFYNGKIVVYEK